MIGLSIGIGLTRAAPIALNLAGALVAGTTYDVVAMQENGWTQVSAVSRQSFTAT